MCIVCDRLAAKSGSPLFGRHLSAPDTPFERLKQACFAEWHAYYEQESLKRLGAGALPKGVFRDYLKQDHLFLRRFRTWSEATQQSLGIDQRSQPLESLSRIIDGELDLYAQHSREWGISDTELCGNELCDTQLRDVAGPHAANAYTRHVLDSSDRGDILGVHVALAPRIAGYAEIGHWLVKQRTTVRMGNPYGAWMDRYTSSAFQHAAQSHVDWINAQMEKDSETWFHELARILAEAAKLQAALWNSQEAPAR